ncbi:MAG: DUF1801 domain-containing protein [Ignavibacteriae bacterium]|nr:DUF1801 domain-containing protein [Ignavibacteriota bacterium]
MTIEQHIGEHIEEYISIQPEQKRGDMQRLHDTILALLPEGRLWYDDGTDAQGKVVCNPSIGYGLQSLVYANGKTKDFYQIGLSAISTGISVYILGLRDKKHLVNTYANAIGKARVTGYCITFKKLADINIDVLVSAMRYGIAETRSS